MIHNITPGGTVLQNSANEHPKEWLLFFYSIPATPVNSRVKIWRKLIKAGAVQLKGGVYILPENEEHREVRNGSLPNFLP